MKKPLFQDAKFGAKYRTRDGRTALFIQRDDIIGGIYIIIEGTMNLILVSENGRYKTDSEDDRDVTERYNSALLRQYSREYYKRNKAKDPDYYKRKYLRNREAHLKCCKKWRDNNKEHIRKREKQYREANKERLRESQSQYRLTKNADKKLQKMSQQVERLGTRLEDKINDVNKLFRDFDDRIVLK